MPPTRIDQKRIEGWLRDIGCEPQLVPEPAALWRYNFQFPFPAVQPQPNFMSVLNPLKPARAVVIVAGVALTPDNHAGFNQLDQDAKLEFVRDLHNTLNRDYVEYMLQGVSDQTVTCPTAIQLSALIYDDGLSLDNFAAKVTAVYKAEIACMACVMRHVGPSGTTGSGQFDFKRLGGLQ
jgi:hypothetical protein